MQSAPHFRIHASGALCEEVLALDVSTFNELAEYVRSLPYD